MGNITLKELAKMLGLSVSSVSKALNDSHEISVETKRKVQELASAHNYRPNMFGKSLKTGRTNTVAIIIPYLANPFQAQILEGAHQAAYSNNYKLIFMQSREDADKEIELLQSLLSQNIDGILISPSANTSVEFLQEVHQEVPIVLIDRIDFELETHKIGVDNERGAFAATQHLIDMGREHILVLNGKDLGVTQKRTAGHKNALLANQIPFSEDNIIEVDYQLSRQDLVHSLREMLQEKLSKVDKPIGILGNTDILTLSTLAILSEMEICVPEEAAVIGFSNTEAADSLNPALSTVVQPALEMGKLGIEKLVELMNCKNRFQAVTTTTKLDPMLVFRKSTTAQPASS
ncbi:LacI family DNA-binding transcriptional regulator [Sphingobacterium corticibacter]|uniref:LacI family transcriptional regulator n=1 Tax=Sphingobacterium corticibacter TaxID=2171749 RepID=A0A2T8HHK9_9SPHI|nr:LacI family DNA-binding transcriptional regulator [Sphingobacterium corticibacter]PVH24895.1 LacI family transcriptional regulator [Sphingobacterium corticibacter]